MNAVSGVSGVKCSIVYGLHTTTIAECEANAVALNALSSVGGIECSHQTFFGSANWLNVPGGSEDSCSGVASTLNAVLACTNGGTWEAAGTCACPSTASATCNNLSSASVVAGSVVAVLAVAFGTLF